MKIRFRRTDGFTAIELLIVITVLSILASTALGAFQGYFLRSKTSEAPVALGKIVDGEIEYYHKNQAFLAAGPTNIPPAPVGPIDVDFTVDPNWALISFAMNPRIYFGYQAVLIAPTQVNSEAMADLDGNGISSLFRRVVTANGNDIQAGGLYIFDELE
jgi:prepilin-type N-terminal cleavage/methylation domain-containing protein